MKTVVQRKLKQGFQWVRNSLLATVHPWDRGTDMTEIMVLVFREMIYVEFCSSSFGIWERTEVLKVFKAPSLSIVLSLKLWPGLLGAVCGKGQITP